MAYTLGIDFGGGASKATLLSDTGEIAAVSTVEYPTCYPRAGRAEQNPTDWYNAVIKNISALLEKSGISSMEIAAVCLDAATHTAVLCDDNLKPLCPAIYWTDTRSSAQAELLRERYGDLIERQTLHSPDTIWTLPQLMWVRENEPEIWKKTRRILFAKDYVRHLLTGDFVTDYIEAQGSMLFDCGKSEWSEELCGIAGIDISCLPPVIRPTDIAGTVTKQAAKETGLAEGTPVLCGTTDTAMEVFASGAVKKGQMTVKLATAGRICVVTDRAYPHRHLVNYSHIQEGLWYPGTATKSCAASLRWYRDTFGGDYKELDKMAAEIPPGCDGLVFHPYLNGELTPHADPLLRGSFVGVSASHTAAHFTRAVLEGVAFSLLDCKNTLEEIGIPHEESAAIIGGGAESPLWRQIVSDALGITLKKQENSDSSFGAAMLAGVATGFFEDEAAALLKCTKTVSKTVPMTDYSKFFKRYKAIGDALKPIYHGDY